MTMITSQSLLNVGTELVLDEVNRTIELVAAGNLVAKDGVTIQALYSKFSDLWSTSTYQDSPFPLNALDALSGQYYTLLAGAAVTTVSTNVYKVFPGATAVANAAARSQPRLV